MEFFLLLAMAAADPQPVAATVVVLAEDSALAEAAEELRQGLGADPRLKVRASVFDRHLAVRRSEVSGDHFEATRARIARARVAYESLAPAQALEELGAVRLELAVMLDDPAARELLASALRLEALTHLYREDAERSMATFATASFLEPDWSPAEEEWPPEARLAHADALATTRRTAPGVLSVRLQPELSVLWLDGVRIGVGATTISDLAPGEHLLMATAPGHQPVAAVVEVSARGRLSEASLYLEQGSGAASVEQWGALAAVALGGAAEGAAFAALARGLGGDDLVIVASDPVSSNGGAVAWVVRPDGRRDGAFVSLAPVSSSVSSIADRLVGVIRVSGGPPDVVPEPWYLSPWAWGPAGGVLLAAGGVFIWALTRDETDRVSLFIGEGR